MSRFSDLSGPPKPPMEMTQVIVEGSFVCQRCGAYVDAAVYVPEASVLTWKCAEGHKSFIEKFTL